MKIELDLVKQFHAKFGQPILPTPSLIPENRYKWRHELMKSEVEEYVEGNQKGDLENVAKELCDVLFSVYGTILEHGSQDKIDLMFEEVWRSNMSKDASEYKMIKGPNYFKADLKKFLE